MSRSRMIRLTTSFHHHCSFAAFIEMSLPTHRYHSAWRGTYPAHGPDKRLYLLRYPIVQYRTMKMRSEC